MVLFKAPLELTNQSVPATPASGRGVLFSRNNDAFWLTSDGRNRRLSTWSVDVTSYGAVPDAKRRTDAVTTNASATVTSATGTFTAADIGKQIFIGDADTMLPVFQGTISAVSSATSITLSGNANASKAAGTCVLIYGTNNATALQNALNAAGALVTNVYLNDNQPMGTGSATCLFPTTTAGDMYLYNTTLNIPANVIVDAEAMLFANVGTAGAANRTKSLTGARGACIEKLELYHNYCMGPDLGEDGEHSSSFINYLKMWGLGTDYNAGASPQSQIGLRLGGFDWRVGYVWMKGGNIGLQLVNTSDFLADQFFIIGASTGFSFGSVKECSINQMRLDTLAYQAGTIDTSDNVTIGHISAFSIISAGFDNTRGLMIGENSSGEKNNNIKLAYSAARTGGKGLVIANTKNSRFELSASNETFTHGTGVAILTALEYGSGNAGNLIVDAMIDPTIATQVTGTQYGTLRLNGASCNIQTFTANGTWTKPAGAKACMVTCVGAGGGGGSGRRGATATNRWGGGGGGGGALASMMLEAAALGDTVTVTVPAGGAGGAARTSDSQNGAGGGSPNPTTFGNHVRARGGNGGAGGTASTGAGGSAVNSFYMGLGLVNTDNAGGASAAGAGVAGTASSAITPRGGGGGGGLAVANTSNAGGAGGGYVAGDVGPIADTTAGGAGGAAGSNNGSPGVAVTGYPFGTGGGGGGSNAPGGAGGTGGAGGVGAGGGGGGSSLNGNNSGAGGAGGTGYCQVITWI